MNKTAAMMKAEEKLGKSLEMAIVDLYAGHQDWNLVADALGVTRQTLYVWRGVLGISPDGSLTTLRGGETVPVCAAPPCPAKPGWTHCPYCGACNPPAATACAGCAGAFQEPVSTIQ